MNNNTEQHFDEEEDDLWDAVMKYRRDHPEKNHIADTGKMIDKAPDSDQNLISQIVAKINEWAEITAELKRQNAELRQSCILYYTEREELKKRLDEANTRIETLVKLVTN